MAVVNSEHDSAGGEPVPKLADTTGFRKPPTTARGARTRAKLIAAARVVFEREGYLDARLTSITAQAKCSTGNFYTYFSSKEEILQAVIEAAEDEMLHPSMPRFHAEEPRPIERIQASNLAYLTSYKKNAGLMLILSQLAASDPKFRELTARRSRAFAQRNARSIEDLQARGLADPTVDAYVASCALSSMVSRMAFVVFCLGEEIPLDELATTLTRLWVNALQLS